MKEIRAATRLKLSENSTKFLLKRYSSFNNTRNFLLCQRMIYQQLEMTFLPVTFQSFPFLPPD